MSDNDDSTTGGKFSIDPKKLSEMIIERDMEQLNSLGGIDCILYDVGTNRETGISDEEAPKYRERIRHFGANRFKKPKKPNFVKLFIGAIADPVVIILIILGVALVAINSAIPRPNWEEDGELPQYLGWIEGASILLAVLIVGVVSAVNDYSKERKFQKLDAESNQTEKASVIRGGEEGVMIKPNSVLAGDIVELQTGFQIPGDGLVLESETLRIDESQLTGETDLVKKDPEKEPFLFSGCKVMEGTGRMVVLSVGKYSQWGRMIRKIMGKKREDTPLQKKLQCLARLIGCVGITFAALTLFILWTGYIITKSVEDKWVPKWTASNCNDENEGTRACESISDDLKAFLGYGIIAITIIAVAVPEGLPLAVTISLAYSVRRMLKDQNLVRTLASCETMGGCTVICSDKTGTLTKNEMNVVMGFFFGKECLPKHLQEKEKKDDDDDDDEKEDYSNDGYGYEEDEDDDDEEEEGTSKYMPKVSDFWNDVEREGLEEHFEFNESELSKKKGKRKGKKRRRRRKRRRKRMKTKRMKMNEIGVVKIKMVEVEMMSNPSEVDTEEISEDPLFLPSPTDESSLNCPDAKEGDPQLFCPGSLDDDEDDEDSRKKNERRDHRESLVYLLCESIAINSSAVLRPKEKKELNPSLPPHHQYHVEKSKTEGALLLMCCTHFCVPYESLIRVREKYRQDDLKIRGFPFSSSLKRMGFLVKLTKQKYQLIQILEQMREEAGGGKKKKNKKKGKTEGTEKQVKKEEEEEEIHNSDDDDDDNDNEEEDEEGKLDFETIEGESNNNNNNNEDGFTENVRDSSENINTDLSGGDGSIEMMDINDSEEEEEEEYNNDDDEKFNEEYVVQVRTISSNPQPRYSEEEEDEDDDEQLEEGGEEEASTSTSTSPPLATTTEEIISIRSEAEDEQQQQEEVYRYHLKGAGEIVLEKCDRYLTPDGTTKRITKDMRNRLERCIKKMAISGKRTITLAFRDIKKENVPLLSITSSTSVFLQTFCPTKLRTDDDDDDEEEEEQIESNMSTSVEDCDDDDDNNIEIQRSFINEEQEQEEEIYFRNNSQQQSVYYEEEEEFTDTDCDDNDDYIKQQQQNDESKVDCIQENSGQLVKSTFMKEKEEEQLKKKKKITGSGINNIFDGVETPSLLEILNSCDQESIEKNMTLICIVGIQDPLRVDVQGAVKRCQKSGIRIRMVTGDNALTARTIADECGILSQVPNGHPNPSQFPGGLVMEGPEFRKLYDSERRRLRDEIVPRLDVLSRSSPEDKHKLVSLLRKSGHVVAVTGDGTNDAPALSEADVGLAMGITGTSVAKHASDIIILDDRFSSIVESVKWGRSIYENIRKFIQFQVTVNIVALLLTVISAITEFIPMGDGEHSVPLTAIQLLWVNLIMDTFAALALATEKPENSLMNRKPYGKKDSLINCRMWCSIITQSVFQLCVLLIVYYAGPYISFFAPNPSYSWIGRVKYSERKIINTMVFNTFVFCQIFNEFCCRKINFEWNICKNIHKSWIFIFVVVFTAIVQIGIIQLGAVHSVGYAIVKTTGLNWYQHLITIALGFLTIPVHFIKTFFVRCYLCCCFCRGRNMIACCCYLLCCCCVLKYFFCCPCLAVKRMKKKRRERRIRRREIKMKNKLLLEKEKKQS